LKIDIQYKYGVKGYAAQFPHAFGLIELDGTIIWYNSSFKKIFDGEKLFREDNTFIYKRIES